MDTTVVVRVEAINDEGAVRFEFGEGFSTDEAVADAIASLERATGDDTWTMNDWAAA